MWSFGPTLNKNKFRNGTKAMEKQKCRINLNKPIYFETNTLDLSEVLMQDSHYNYIKNQYGDKAEMLLTDTDSCMYKIEAENVYKTSIRIKS